MRTLVVDVFVYSVCYFLRSSRKPLRLHMRRGSYCADKISAAEIYTCVSVMDFPQMLDSKRNIELFVGVTAVLRFGWIR